MSRELKFRIWDNEENKYFKPIYEAYKGNLLDLSISLSGELLRRTIEFPSEHESRFPDRYVIEQYTGLKDINGIDVYESDIVERKETGCEGSYIAKYEVVYGKHGFVLKVIQSHIFKKGAIIQVMEELKVIGNIHESTH